MNKSGGTPAVTRVRPRALLVKQEEIRAYLLEVPCIDLSRRPA